MLWCHIWRCMSSASRHMWRHIHNVTSHPDVMMSHMTFYVICKSSHMTSHTMSRTSHMTSHAFRFISGSIFWVTLACAHRQFIHLKPTWRRIYYPNTGHPCTKLHTYHPDHSPWCESSDSSSLSSSSLPLLPPIFTAAGSSPSDTWKWSGDDALSSSLFSFSETSLFGS